MQIQEKAHRILQQPVCNRCLGRQFAQLLSGFTNEQRGHMLRAMVAMSIDKEHGGADLDMSNFHSVNFHKLELKTARKKCSVCEDIFLGLDKIAEKVSRASKKIEFSTFLIGTRISFELISREESLWERVGIDYCEPIKAELNREVGKLVEKRTGAAFSQTPDVNFIVRIPENSVEVSINPLFIYGEYQKLVRGIPQTRWPSKKYKTSVEEIMAKPFITATGGSGHKLHGLGREDVDARCLGWRPFVLEILNPKKRTLRLSALSKRVGRGIKIKALRASNIGEVRSIKEERSNKTYRALVVCDGVKRSDLTKLKQLVGNIKQKTPERVLHRRADKFRNRKVLSLKTKYVKAKKFELVVTGEAGLYVKELISGDNGRTTPSVSSVLQQNCLCEELDVLKIHRVK